MRKSQEGVESWLQAFRTSAMVAFRKSLFEKLLVPLQTESLGSEKNFLPLLGIEIWSLGGTAHYHVTMVLTFHSLCAR
jgi:hypothetical protein